MRKVVYPGTFDPITNGHLDVITRAHHIFDEVIVAIAEDNNKKPLFTLEERLHLAELAVADLKIPVRVMIFKGLLVHFVKSQKASAIIRGLRAVSDFEFEFQLALMNRKIDDHIETIFLMPKDTYTYLSSTIIKEISRLGGPIESFVPPAVEKAMQKKFRAKAKE